MGIWQPLAGWCFGPSLPYEGRANIAERWLQSWVRMRGLLRLMWLGPGFLNCG